MPNHQTRVYENILEMLPDVDNPPPLVRLNRTVPFEHTKVYAKLEWYNPFGSVKDRVAANMIQDASDKGSSPTDSNWSNRRAGTRAWGWRCCPTPGATS